MHVTSCCPPPSRLTALSLPLLVTVFASHGDQAGRQGVGFAGDSNSCPCRGCGIVHSFWPQQAVSALFLGPESITSPCSIPNVSQFSCQENLRAQRAEWDRDTRHNRVAELSLWGGSWRLRQGLDNQCLRGKICPGRGIPAWEGTLAATVEVGEMQHLPLNHMAFPSTLSHSQAPPGLAWSGRQDTPLLPAFR